MGAIGRASRQSPGVWERGPGGGSIFYYLEDQERTLDSATDKVLVVVTS